MAQITKTLIKTKPVKIGCLEDDPFLLGFTLFSGAFAVSFREGIPAHT